jgi:hypothetical protein
MGTQMLCVRTLHNASFICPVSLLERRALRIEGAENILGVDLVFKGTSDA